MAYMFGIDSVLKLGGKLKIATLGNHGNVSVFSGGCQVWLPMQ